MKLKSRTVAAVILVAMTAASQAQTLTGADTDAILQAADAMGVATLDTQPNGDPLINGMAGDVAYQIYFRNCTANADCEDLNFYAGFSQNQPPLETINTWNSDKRFSRAYLDEVGDAVVEMDLDLVAGVTPAYLQSQMDLWKLVLGEFTTHIGYGVALQQE